MCYQLCSHSSGSLEIRKQQRNGWRHTACAFKTPPHTHTDNDALSTISTGPNTTEAPDPGLKLNLPPLSHTHSEDYQRRRQTLCNLHIYSWGVWVTARAPLLTPEHHVGGAEWNWGGDRSIFHITAEVITPRLSVLPSDVICCLTHPAHLHDHRIKFGLEANSWELVVNSSNLTRTRMQRAVFVLRSEATNKVTSATSHTAALWRQFQSL